MVEGIERVNALGFAAVTDMYAEDVALVFNGVFAGRTETITGKPAVLDWFVDFFGEFADSWFEITESRGQGDRVLIVATHHARGLLSGVPVEQRFAYVFTVHEGRVGRLEVWAERESALEAFSAD